MAPSDWRGLIGALIGHSAARTLRAVFGRYGAAGGALLAGGLAYSALFAIVPLVLVAAGLTGLLLDDPALRSQVVATIADVLPPLRGILTAVLAEVASSATTISLIGAATLLWGGSRFILAFEDAMSRMAGGPRTRNVVRRNMIGLVTAVTLVASVILGAVFAGVAAFLDAAVTATDFAALSLLTQVALAGMPIALAIGSMVLVFRFVPEARPSWGAAALPAVVVGIVLTLTVRLFVFIAPRLIGAAATIGTLATVFAALAWLGLTFQAILLGTAWVSERHQAEARRRGAAS